MLFGNASRSWAAVCVLLAIVRGACAQDWPQWCGPNRDAKAVGFHVPKTWPKELTRKWKITVGDGVATPALVGDKLYVFTRQDGKEVMRCLEAGDGQEIWNDKYEARAADGGASGFPGPRSSPAVGAGKVVTLGVRGTLSCYDAAKGTVVWRKEDFKGILPRFYASSSPIIVDGLVVAQLGSERNGGIAAYDLTTGDEKWKWTDDGTSYASPTLLEMGGEKFLIAETSKKIVAIGLKDGKLRWETRFAPESQRVNAGSPMVEGRTIFYGGAGRGATAVTLEKNEKSLEAKELWSNKENSVLYNTPLVKNGMVFALSDKDNLFCIDAKGKTAWTSSISGDRAGRGRRGFGCIVDAGSIVMLLHPSGELIVFEPTDKEFKEIAKYKVASGGTFAYPILAGSRIFVKDGNSLILYATE